MRHSKIRASFDFDIGPTGLPWCCFLCYLRVHLWEFVKSEALFPDNAVLPGKERWISGLSANMSCLFFQIDVWCFRPRSLGVGQSP